MRWTAVRATGARGPEIVHSLINRDISDTKLFPNSPDGSSNTFGFQEATLECMVLSLSDGSVPERPPQENEQGGNGSKTARCGVGIGTRGCVLGKGVISCDMGSVYS